MVDARTPITATNHSVFRQLVLFVALGTAACVAAAAGTPVVVADAAKRCAELAGVKVPASAFAQETSGALVTQATVVSGDAVTAVPAYCKATGSIDAAKAGDLPILFQVNLPFEWNRKTVQFGGAGSNGVVITGTGNVANAGSAKTPLARA